MTNNLFRSARRRAGLKQYVAADKLNISVKHLSCIENNRKNPSWNLVQRMVHLYGPQNLQLG
jgi:DNA-binding XRE family transcriptional regulator